MFGEQKTALILDELQTWYDGLHNEPGPEGKKYLQWAFNFIQILSEIAEDRPDLFSLIVSVRDNTTDAFQQIHRKGPVVIDFKGETAREDRKRLVLHRLFKNRSNIPSATIEQTVSVYAKERNRLLFAERSPADQTRLAEECVECWPYSPELLTLLEDQILMAAAAQDSRDFIRMLAEVFRARGASASIITPADFSIDDDECGVTTLIDSFATSADQERLREKAIRNLSALKEANVAAPHMREVISSIWVRSLSSVQAGGAREGINLQFARVLFNHDLPWNPMDLEQRIGRIHRYGQAHTAQVYNVLSADTIEGQIFLLLEEKLLQIARTLGKVDEFGQVAEDLRSQILGQLSERISYDKLYQDAVRDPKLVRTRQELDVAIENAQTARQVVWELFQDLEGFRLDEYKMMDDAGAGMARLVRYVQESVSQHGGSWRPLSVDTFEVAGIAETTRLTQTRETAQADDQLALLGLEHPIVKRLFEQDILLPAHRRGIVATTGLHFNGPGVLTIWRVVIQNQEGMTTQRVVPIGVDGSGQRRRDLEVNASAIRSLDTASLPSLQPEQRSTLLHTGLPEIVRRDLAFRGHLSESSSISSRLLAWIEIEPSSGGTAGLTAPLAAV
jgi:hypothetical protein